MNPFLPSPHTHTHTLANWHKVAPFIPHTNPMSLRARELFLTAGWSCCILVVIVIIILASHPPPPPIGVHNNTSWTKISWDRGLKIWHLYRIFSCPIFHMKTVFVHFCVTTRLPVVTTEKHSIAWFDRRKKKCCCIFFTLPIFFRSPN